MVPGSGYSLAETVPAGWDQTSAHLQTTAARSRTSTSPQGETVTCTFSNRKRGQIIVVKNATPNDPQDFSFTTAGGLPVASFDLDDDSRRHAVEHAARSPTSCRPRATRIQETVPSGWDQTSATCSDGSPVTNVDVARRRDRHLHLQQPQAGVVTVVKDAVPNDPQDFAFNVAVPGDGSLDFSLDDDSDPDAVELAHVQQPGASLRLHRSTRRPQPAGICTSASCDDGSAPSNIGLSPGEHVTCTFTNTKRGQIVVVQDSVPNDPQDFSFTAGGGLSPASFQLDDDSDPALSNTRTFTNVPVGAGYSIAQTPASGWLQSGATCDDGSPVSDIDVGPDETVTCTFTNTQARRDRGRVKDSPAERPAGLRLHSRRRALPVELLLDDDSDGTLSNTRTFTNLTPAGGYSLAEAVPAGGT